MSLSLKKEMDFKISIYKDYTYELNIKGDADNNFVMKALSKAQKKKKVDIENIKHHIEEIPIISGSFFLIERYLRKGTYQDIRKHIIKKYSLDFITFNIKEVTMKKISENLWTINIDVEGMVDKK